MDKTNMMAQIRGEIRRGRGGAPARMGALRVAALLACALCLLCALGPVQEAHCGRLQDFIQNLIGANGANSSGNKNNNNNSNDDSSNSNDSNQSDSNSNDSDTASSNDNSNEQQHNNNNNNNNQQQQQHLHLDQLTPMMSALNPFMRYPTFYDNSFGTQFGAAYAPLSFASSANTPLASFLPPLGFYAGDAPTGPSNNHQQRPQQLLAQAAGSFPPFAGHAPSSFGSFGQLDGLHGSASSLSPASVSSGPSSSARSNMFAAAASSQPFLGPFLPYYGKR